MVSYVYGTDIFIFANFFIPLVLAQRDHGVTQRIAVPISDEILVPKKHETRSSLSDAENQRWGVDEYAYILQSFSQFITVYLLGFKVSFLLLQIRAKELLLGQCYRFDRGVFQEK